MKPKDARQHDWADSAIPCLPQVLAVIPAPAQLVAAAAQQVNNSSQDCSSPGSEQSTRMPGTNHWMFFLLVSAWPHEEFKVKTSMCDVMTDWQYLQLDIVVQKRVWASTVRESEITKHTSHCSRRDPWCQGKRETRSSSVDAGLWSSQHSGALRLENIHIWDWIKPLGTHYRHAKNTVLPFTYKNGDFSHACTAILHLAFPSPFIKADSKTANWLVMHLG